MSNYRCHRGVRCADSEIVKELGGRVGAATNTEDGLCPTCVRHLERALTDLPRDYVELNQILAKVRQAGNEPVSGTRDPAMPLRGDVEAAQADMVHETLCWAESTAEVLGVTFDTQVARDSRAGVNLERSCRVLLGGMSVLLALHGAEHINFADEDTPVVSRDGVEGAVVLLDLHHRARAILGQSRLVHHLPAPCPNCERTALRREDGHDTVDCAGCAERFTWEEYNERCSVLSGTTVPV